MVIKHLLEALNSSVKAKEIVEEIPETVKTYDDMVKYVDETYQDVNDIVPAILDILETTNFQLSRTYYKTKIGNYMVYFDRAYTEDDIRIYQRGKRNLQLQLVYVNLKKPGKMEKEIYTIYTDRESNILNNELIRKTDLDLSKVFMPYIEMENACRALLSRLLYIAQGEFQDPVNNKTKNREYVKELSDSEFDHDPKASKNDVLTAIAIKIERKVAKKHERIFEILVNLLKNGNGNLSYTDLENKIFEKNVHNATIIRHYKKMGKDGEVVYGDNIFEHVKKSSKFIYYHERPIFTCKDNKATINFYGCFLMWSDSCHDYRIGVYYTLNDSRKLLAHENFFLTKDIYNWMHGENPIDYQACKIAELDHYKLGIALITNILYESKNYQNL